MPHDRKTLKICDRIRTINSPSRSDGYTEVLNCIAWLLVLSFCFLSDDRASRRKSCCHDVFYSVYLPK